MIGNVNQPSTYQIMDVDGTLKAGAVDVEAVLADNVVTAAKIADNVIGAGFSPGSDMTLEGVNDKIGSAALTTTATTLAGAINELDSEKSSQNLVWDSFNRDLAPYNDWDGRLRWLGTGTLSLSSVPGALNPYGNANLLLNGAANKYGGKLIYLDELGIAVDEVLSFAALASMASGTHNLYVRARDESGYVGALYTSAGVVANGTMKQLSVNGFVVPSGATKIHLMITDGGTGNEVAIAALWGNRGATVGRLESPYNESYWRQEIRNARGSTNALTTRLDVSLNADGSLKTTSGRLLDIDFWGRYNLQSWQAQIAKINRADATSQAVVAILGDSWVHGVRLHLWLQAWLWSEYGNAGPGFGHAGDLTNLAGTQPNGITRTTSGTWTLYDEADGTEARAVNLGHALSTDQTTPASIAWTGAAHTIVLHYCKLPNGGDFRYRVDSGSWTTVATANATEIFDSVTISGLDGNSHTLTVEVVTASIAGVKILGCDLQKTGNGVRVHDLGNNGSTAADWVAVDATIWQAGLTAIAPHLVVVLLGVNDRNGGRTPAQYYSDLGTLITRIRAAVPLADILLIAPGDISGTYAYTAADYANQAFNLAVAQNCAMLDLRLNLPSYANGNSRGMYADTLHLSEAGGQMFANLLIRQFLQVK